MCLYTVILKKRVVLVSSKSKHVHEQILLQN